MKITKNDEYDDIINLPHHQSATRPHMTLHDRAAQFSPFAALTGHDAAIAETARLTDKKIYLSEDRISVINAKLQVIGEHIQDHPEITVTYFRQDDRKDGGAYITKTGRIKIIDVQNGAMIFTDLTMIAFDDIFDMESDIFKDIDFQI